MFEESNDDRFGPQNAIELLFKPLYFINKQKTSARDAADFGEMMKRLQTVDWKALEQDLKETAVQGEREYITFEGLRHDKHMVAKKIIAPYVMRLANIPQLSAKLRAQIAAAIYYCLFRWLEHDFKANNNNAAKDLPHRKSKYTYIKQLAKAIESELQQSQLTSKLFSSDEVLAPWAYRKGKKAPEYEEAFDIKLFIENNKHEFEEAWKTILA